MKQINDHRKQKLCTALAVLTSILLLVGFGIGISVVKTSEAIQEEKLETLHQAEGRYSEDTIILRSVPLSRAETLADKLHARLRTASQGDFSVLYLPEGVTIEDVYQDDTNLAYIRELEPDFYADAQALNATGQELIVSPPEYSVLDPLYERTTQLEYLHMGDVWEKTRGAGVTVAIIDTGIDTDHPEFSGRISDWSYNASEDKTVHDYGISVIEDPDGHGTAVAGVVGAGLNNGVGIAGVAPEVELLIIRCDCDESGKFVRSSDLVFGLAYAIERDADVINMSFNTPVNIFEEYTKLAVDSDIICVAAAGNASSSLAVYPAADPNVIGVGGFDTQTWSLADFSNYGDNSDLLAPGVVYTTSLDGEYAVQTGTSVSSPMVAGAVALYLSVNPYQELADIRMMLEASSVDLGALGEDWLNGFGALDIYAAVCGDTGTITYDMLTDEISSQTQKFVRGRTVQIMPEPERQNVVFDGWYYDAQCTDECEYYTEVFNQDITLYASWINEDEGTPYLYTVLDDGTAEIRSYFGKRRYLTVPDQIEGYTVSSIGENAFSGNTRLREVKLPNTLTNIGLRAFYNCTALLSIEIPEHVQNIGADAFNGCVRLQTVGIVPNGDLMGIGDYAFSNCGISSFLIPEKLNFLGEAPWMGSANMLTIAVAEGNTSFRMINHALYDMSGETLIYCPPALSGKYTVAGGTTAITEYAFYRSRFTVIEFPESLCSIGDSGFAKSHVTSVVIPSSVTQLGKSVWFGCNSLSFVNLDTAEGLRDLPSSTFSGCFSLRSIRIPNWFQSLGSSTFLQSGLEEIVFEEGSRLASIGAAAFQDSQLKQITVPAGVQTIASSTFSRCAALTEVSFTADSLLYTIGSFAFENCWSLEQIQFPESLKTVQQQAFYKSGLTQLHLGKNISTLGKGAFAYCSKLPLITVSEENEAFAAPDGVLMSKDGKRLITFPAAREGAYTLPDTVTDIAAYGFSGAAQLTEVILNQNLVTISAYAFEYCGRMQTPILPESVISIGEFSFSYCTSMSEMLLIPQNVISLGRYAFTQDYNLSQIVIAQDSVLSRIGYGTFANCGITDFRIPASITSMGQEVFSGCKSLKKVTFAAGCKLEFLAAWTFKGTTALEEILFEENCALRKIEARALEQLHKLKRINLENLNSLEAIDNYAFQSCYGLSSIKLPSNVVEIGRYAFSGCEALKQIIIPEMTEFIGRYAFAGTRNLKVYFEASVLPLYLQEYWDYDIFGFYLGTGKLLTSGDWTYTLTQAGEASIVSYKGSAADLTIDTIDGHPVVGIGMGAFMNNTTLKTVNLPDTLLGIYKNAFAGTTALTEITIPDTVAVIDESVFRGSGISEVNFGADSQLAVLGRGAFENTASLTSFTLPEGVERIRDDTFRGSGLQTFALEAGSKLTEIGHSAFANSGLLAIELPDGLAKIDHYAFSGSANLKSVTFGTGADLSVYSNAFYQTGLETVDIPANVVYLGEFCFTDCQNLTTIAVAEENIWYASVDGVLYSKDLSRLLCCPAGKTGELSIPDDVTALAFGAFEGSDLSGIYISDSSRLSTLGYRAFLRCDNLEQITIPDGLLSIDRYAFAYCPNLTTVNIGEGSQLSSIGYAAFYQCPSLTEIYIPGGVHEIDDYAFYDCSSLTDLNIAQDSQLKFIGNFAFQNTAVTELIMPEELYEIGNYAFQNSGMDTLVVNENVFWIGDYAFADCGLANTTVLTFPENMEYLGNKVLKGATAIQELTIPFLGTTELDPFELVDLVGNSTGSSSTPRMLHTVNVLHGDIAPMAFLHQNQVKNIILGDDCKSIGYNAFSYSGITSIHLPASLAVLGNEALANCSNLQSVTVAEENACYEMVDGVLYDEAVTKAILAPSLLTGEVRIPNTVTKIGDSAFRGCGKINGLILPESLKEIGRQAFDSCKSLKEIVIPDSVTTLGIQSFYGCSGAKKIVVGAGVKEIQRGAFYSCGTTGCEVELGECVEIIGDSALAFCGVKNITIPESVKIVGFQAFYECRKLETVTMGSSVESIENNAFYNCIKLTTVTLTDSLLTISNNVFNGSGIVSIRIPKNVTSIGQGALGNCTSLETIEVDTDNVNYCSQDGCLYNGNKTELLAVPAKISGTVRIPDGVAKLGDYTFSKCGLLEEIIIPDSVTEIGSACFSNCTSLLKVSLPRQVTAVGWGVFDYCTSLQEIVIPDSITTLNNYFFRGCSSLLSVSLPEGLTKLGEGCFQYCTALQSITLPDSLTTIQDRCFWDCKALNEIHVGSNITFVGDRAFKNSGHYHNADNWEGAALYLDDLCIEGKVDVEKTIRIKEGTRLIADSAFTSNGEVSIIETVILPDSVLQICGNAFSGNRNLRVMRMSANVQTIGSQALSSNSGLRSIHIPGSVRNADNFLGNPAGDAYPELRYVLIEDGACLEGICFRGSPNMNTMVVPYDSQVSMKTILNQYNPVVLKNLVVTGNHLAGTFLSGVNSSTDIYCTVPEGYFSFSGRNKIYYDGQWHLAEFWSDGILVQITPYALGAVVEVPSSATMEIYALDDDAFLGWDINGDGEADQIPATLSNDMKAVALWGHVHTVVTDPAVAPTCTTTGLTEGSHCATCGHVIVHQEEIPMTNHKYKADTNAPTCVEKGYTTHTCTVCGDSYVDTYVDALGHDMGEWTTVTDATCTEDGSERQDCSRCDHYEIRTIEAIGHSYESIVTAPTCTEQGYTTHICANCGDRYVDTYVDALGHDMGEWTTVKEATCTEEGSKRRGCSRCDHYETRKIEATGHSFGVWFVNRAATCTETGENRRNCINCSHYEMEVIPATGHSYESVVTVPTCTAQGYTTHTCTACGDSYADTYMDALGHDMGEWTTVTEATCTEDGSERRDCSRCDHYETRTIEATGHNYEAVVTAPTCTDQGYTTHTCTVCSDSYVDTYVDALGHDMGEWITVTEANCTEDGSERRDCSRCDYYEIRTIEAIGHSYESIVTAPTCTEQGYTTHTCANCGDSYVDTYVDALGHDMREWTTVTEATCTGDGSERRDCSHCDHYETRTIEATGHSYESIVTAPTCTEQGYTTHTCANCGDSYVDTYVDALGHDMDEWTNVTEATCTEDGSERRDCSRCNHYEIRAIEAAGHSYEHVVTAPTCTEQGFVTHTCSACGDNYVDTYVDALGHDMGEWSTVTEATCTEDGSERQDCSRCDHYEIRAIEAAGHSYEHVVAAPTCVEKGYTTHTCANCGNSYVDTYVDALGHDMGEWITVTEANCTEDGSERRDCSRCDHYETRTIEATGHSFGAWFVNRSATCTKDGENRRNCKNCSHYETEVIPATGHSYESVVTAPTCVDKGYTTHTCTVCGDSYVDTYVDALGHDMGEWTTVAEVTCTEAGSERRDCSRCDHFETRIIEATGHSYESIVIAPTCVEQGYTTHTCSVCGNSYVDTYVDALGHDMGEWTTITEATCTEDGSERQDCSRCDHYEIRTIKATGHSFGAWFVNRSATCTEAGENRRNCNNCSHYETEVIPAKGHSYESVVTAPTCVEKGYTTHTCANCGDSYVDTYVDALGHDMGEWSTVTEATCTDDGSERQDCSRCDHYETRTIKATGHSFGAWFVNRSATCTKEGENRRNCNNCSHYETEVIPATGHSYEAVVTAPTCVEKGCTTHTCANCGDSYVDTYVDALGHDMDEWTTVMEATCTEDGSERRDCSRCDHYETRTIKATGHSFGAWFVNRSATCTNDGESRRNCSNCGHYETEGIPATGHDYESVVTDPTCTEQGYTTHTCTVCGDSYVDTYVDALGHDMGEWTTATEATCTEDGSERQECSRCDHYETRIVKATGHSFGAWFVNRSATCTEDGENRRNCNACSHYETKVIPATGHSYESVVTAPTCVEKGYTTHTCTNCGDSYVDTYVDALGHDMDEWTTVTEATCTGDGSERRDCSRCDNYETRIVKAIGHSFGAWFVNRSATCTNDGERRRNCSNCGHYETEGISATGHDYESVVTDPTCTDQGYTTHTCANCGDSYVDTYVDALGHDMGEWTTATEATCTEDGSERRDCSRCDHYEIRAIEAAGHSYEHVVAAPTCVEKGYTTHTCANCGDSYVDTYVDALGHDMGEWTTVTEATCTGDGSERRDCSHCDHYETRIVKATGHSFGAWFVNRSATCTKDGENRRNCKNCSHYETEIILATGHSYGSVVTAPTCTDQGYTTHTCANCGDSYMDAYVDALGHDMGEWTTITEATCTEDGSERRDCSRCDHYETRTIKATGHSFGTWFVNRAATCTEDGENRRNCNACSHYETEVVPAIGHDYESVVTDPTCTEQGYTTHTCTVCGDSYVDTYVDALGHDMDEWTTVTEATCTEDGQELRECVRCDRYETRIIEARGHSYDAAMTKPTCTEQGYTQYVCSVCGDSYISDYVVPTGHDHKPAVTAPTCTEQGYTTYTCHCGDCYVSDYTDPLGHDMGAWETATEAACTENGEEIRECSRCDHSESRDIEALGHDWNEGIVTVEPTEENVGEMTYTCERCGETKTEVIPELEHEHRYDAVVTAPTCTEQGYTTHTCRCGDSYVDTYVEALGHDMGEWFTVTEATCTADGMEQRDCSRCEYHETQVIEATGHDYESVVTDPTCSAQGFTTHTCHCGDSYIDSYTAALGHSFTTYVSDGNATCTQDGTKTSICDRCDAVDTVIDKGSAHGHEFTEWTVVQKPTETAEGLESRYCLNCGVEETRAIACLVNPFGDVPSGSFYYEPVMWAVENGITNGTSATTFGPNDQCMRAHVVTFLWRAMGSPEPNQTDNPFVDVKPSDFYYKPVLWALENGITSGMDATHFGPTSYCNRAQVVTFLYRTMESPEVTGSDNPFADVPDGQWFTAPVLWAVENGITNGLSATAFGPNTICNRAQIVTFLYRAFVD